MVLRTNCFNYGPIDYNMYKNMNNSGDIDKRKVGCKYNLLINGECPPDHEKICMNKYLRPEELEEIKSHLFPDYNMNKVSRTEK